MATIGRLLEFGLEIYSYLIIIYILMSWFPNARESSFGQMIGAVVEPYLEPFRRLVPSLGMIDISPIIAIVALHFARSGVQALFF